MIQNDDEPGPDESAGSLPGVVRISLGSESPREESFLGGRLVISTGRGVRDVERMLLESLDLPLEGSVMVVGTRQALVALAAGRLHPGTRVRWLGLDAYELHRASEGLRRNPSPNVRLELEADIPAGLDLDWVVLPVPHAEESMLAGELLRQAERALGKRGKLLAATDNRRDRWLHRRVVDVFGAATIHARGRRGVAYIARRKPGHRRRERDFRRGFSASVLGVELDLETRPGVFAHGKLDEGALALTEVAALTETTRVVDLGCGSGAVGIAAARVATRGFALLVDSSPRAARAARANALRNAAAGNSLVLLAHDLGAVADSSFDLVLANPPYFADHRITQQFVRDGFRVLAAGGELLLVTKSPERPEAIVRGIFGSCEALSRRGYHVLRGRKGEGRSPR